MKKNILLLLTFFFIFSNCSTNSSDSITLQKTDYLWHLVQVTGGFAGIDEQFSTDTIIWNFDNETSALDVENNNIADSIEDGFDTGSYPYSVSVIDEKTYLSVNETEFGSFEIVNDTLIINQNILSAGQGADGFIYTFQVETIIID